MKRGHGRHPVLGKHRETVAQREEREALSRELSDWLAMADALRPSAPYEPGCPLRTEALVIEGERVSLRADGGRVVCPWASCPHHLATDRMPNGKRSVAWDIEELLEQPFTCALDAADHAPEGMDLGRIGELMGSSRQYAHRLEQDGMRKLREAAAQGAFRGF